VQLQYGVLASGLHDWSANVGPLFLSSDWLLGSFRTQMEMDMGRGKLKWMEMENGTTGQWCRSLVRLSWLIVASDYRDYRGCRGCCGCRG